MTATVSVHEAKTHLSRLIERVLAGEEVVISRNKEPVVRLVREAPPKTNVRRIGTMKGRLGELSDEAMAPLPDEFLGLDLWGGKPL
ncbi:type II toxin-antitoxin system Phd/YefM family antitoxin [Sphingomonas sp. LT1P40]|uniref:type II toxin-antitoxin system Phd/YefM family antitoxin n=1 Tax=Alteristakelama amylovorans TaxID=3096166 RepID=UPI002FCC4EB4